MLEERSASHGCLRGSWSLPLRLSLVACEADSDAPVSIQLMTAVEQVQKTMPGINRITYRHPGSDRVASAQSGLLANLRIDDNRLSATDS